MECSVCYDDTTSTCKLMCGHSFCMSCIKKWYLKSEEETTCPMCRQKLYFKGMHKYCEKWDEERYEEHCEQIFSNLFDKTIEEADEENIKYLIHDLGVMEFYFNKFKTLDWEYLEDLEYAIDGNSFWFCEKYPPSWYELLMKDISLMQFSKNNSKHIPNVHYNLQKIPI